MATGTTATQAAAGLANTQRRWLADLLATPSRAPDLRRRLTSARAPSLTLGTGADLVSAVCRFALAHTRRELLLVTCFWARSASLAHVAGLLRALSAAAVARGGPRVRVRICVSSVSLAQKLCGPWDARGRVYGAAEWEATLGLPAAAELAGLEMQVKCVFVPPFSVMHSKFVVVDRQVCLLPSCNVSWEDWFEGCVDMRGPIVGRFVEYWEEFWGRGDPGFSLSSAGDEAVGGTAVGRSRSGDQLNSRESATEEGEIPPFGVAADATSTTSAALPASIPLSAEEIEAVFLPSPHHQDPRFRPFPFQKAAECPRTPLNSFMLQALEGAKEAIFMQTPNVTSPPVLDALHRAMSRGVDVRIVTNERLMRVEQLVTAGTTTPRCMAGLINSYESLCRQETARRDFNAGEDPSAVGTLVIDYFDATAGATTTGNGSQPVASHFKLTVIDSDVVVLGSGNMDRASWYTSQELGVALLSPDVAAWVSKHVLTALEGRLRSVYVGTGLG